jgi:hypothetical protein
MPRLAGLVVPTSAAVLAFVALGKVLSPQYMIWVAPLAPLLWIARERAAALLVAAAVLLSQLEYPHRYTPVVEGETGAQLLLGARNAALLAALVLLLVRLAREAGREVDSLQAWIGSRQWPPPTRAHSSDNAGSASRRSAWRSSGRSPTRRT